MKQKMQRVSDKGDTRRMFEDLSKKPAKKDKPPTAQSKPRSMSNEEFIKKYKDSPTSDRIREEAIKSVNKDKASDAAPMTRDTAPMTRVDMGGVSFGDPDMTREEQESIAKNLLKGAAAIGSVGAAGYVGPAVRGVQTANRQRIIGRNYEAMSKGQQDAAAKAANFAARGVQAPAVVSGMKFGGSTGRGGGCEIRGKTKGRMI